MAEKKNKALYTASFLYDKETLDDFERMYLDKKTITIPVRIVLGVIGVAGAVYFGLSLYHEGIHFGWDSLALVGYLLICSIMIVLSVSRGKARPDDTLKKYRKYYTDRRCSFQIDEEGIEMHLEKQKNYARSKYREIYGLYETESCFYFVIKGKAYYILPKRAVTGGTLDEVRKYLERKCQKKFMKYPTE